MNTFWYPKTSFHDPDYVPAVYYFETVEELLALPPIASYRAPGIKFELSDSYLMLVLKDGFEWWVVGRIGIPEKVDLPKWTGPKILIRLPDNTERVASNGEVSRICGDEITLKDGIKATRIRRERSEYPQSN
jgi:hypothetical protein